MSNDSILLNGVKSSFNILKDWQNRTDNQEVANDLLQLNRLEKKSVENKNKEEKGKKITSIGASGISSASFNDVLLSEDLKNKQAQYVKDLKAEKNTASLESEDADLIKSISSFFPTVFGL